MMWLTIASYHGLCLCVCDSTCSLWKAGLWSGYVIVFVVDKSCLLSMYTILSAKLADTLYNIKCVAVRKVTHKCCEWRKSIRCEICSSIWVGFCSSAAITIGMCRCNHSLWEELNFYGWGCVSICMHVCVYLIVYHVPIRCFRFSQGHLCSVQM